MTAVLTRKGAAATPQSIGWKIMPPNCWARKPRFFARREPWPISLRWLRGASVGMLRLWSRTCMCSAPKSRPSWKSSWAFSRCFTRGMRRACPKSRPLHPPARRRTSSWPVWKTATTSAAASACRWRGSRRSPLRPVRRGFPCIWTARGCSTLPWPSGWMPLIWPPARTA